MDLVELRIQSDFESVNRHPWEQARLSLINRLIGKNNASSDALTILDVGCGDTYVAEGILKAFPNASLYCIDIAFSQEMLDFYKEKYQGVNLFVYASLEEAMQDCKQEINAVLFLDVIEHIEDEIAVLKQVKSLELVSSKTDFIITVPAFQSLFTQHDIQLGHYRRYIKKTLHHSLNESGLKSVEMNYFFSVLYPPRVIQWIKERVLGAKKEEVGISAWKGGKFVTGLVKGVLETDTKIVLGIQKMGIPLIGLSLYTIARKQ